MRPAREALREFVSRSIDGLGALLILALIAGIGWAAFTAVEVAADITEAKDRQSAEATLRAEISTRFNQDDPIALVSIVQYFDDYCTNTVDKKRWDFLGRTRRVCSLRGNILVTQVFLEDIRNELPYEIVYIKSDVYDPRDEGVYFIVGDGITMAIRTGHTGPWVAQGGTLWIQPTGEVSPVDFSPEREEFVRRFVEMRTSHPLDEL